MRSLLQFVPLDMYPMKQRMAAIKLWRLLPRHLHTCLFIVLQTNTCTTSCAEVRFPRPSHICAFDATCFLVIFIELHQPAASNSVSMYLSVHCYISIDLTPFLSILACIFLESPSPCFTLFHFGHCSYSESVPAVLQAFPNLMICAFPLQGFLVCSRG